IGLLRGGNVSLTEQRFAKAKPGLRIVIVEGDRLAVERGRLDQAALAEKQIAEMVEHLRLGAVEQQRTGKTLLRLAGLALRLERDAQQLQNIGIVGVALGEDAIEPLGVGVAARPLQA